MNANAPPPRHGARVGAQEPVGDGRGSEARRPLHAGSQQVVESWGEQSWSEFCGALEQPAFLLAVTGFGEL